MQNISEQVAGYMRDPSRMIKRMQLRRSSVGTFGKVSLLTCKKYERAQVSLTSRLAAKWISFSFVLYLADS